VKTIHAYVHTHWDREWYQPFETFRTYLVGVLRHIVEELESGRLEKFYLDGQAVIIEDALAICPELAPRIKALMQRGVLSAGPWYVLPDELLVCGESLIRNLKNGIALVREFGSPAMVGYSPDTFGHTADLPRILMGFGIGSAFVWRGVPALSSGPCFWWKSPDGSKVLAYHLSRGYYQSSLIEKTASGSPENALAEYVDELANFAEDRRQWENSSLYDRTPNALLLPIGADHTAPPPNLDDILRRVNEKLKAKQLQIKTTQLQPFAEMLIEQAKSSEVLVAVLSKELRDNSASLQYGNAYLLPGVLSTRLYLKRENRQAERRLFRFVEPLMSMLRIRGLIDYPHGELAHALKLLLKNQPHDSICGCSVDAVHDEMMIRYARIQQVISPLLEQAKSALSGLPDNAARSCEDPASSLHRLRLINPSGRTFTGPVPIEWFSPLGKNETGSSESSQIIESRPSDQLFAGWGRVPYYSMVQKQTGLIWVENLAPYAEENVSWPCTEYGDSKYAPVKARAKSIDNGILKVSVADTGSLKVVWTREDGVQQKYELAHQLRDCADAGDTYNFDPLPGDKYIDGKLISIEVKDKGPLQASLLLKYEIRVPERLVEEAPANGASPTPSLPQFKRALKKVKHEIETELILKRGSRILEFETKFVNSATDHRLEVHLATGHPALCTFSENHFSLLRRYHRKPDHEKLPVEIGCELECDRFPAQRFVVVNAQVIMNKGLPEYGCEDDSIALTLLRSVSMLSRGRMQSRGGGAGPHLEVPGAQCLGLNRTSYAWAPLSLGDNAKKFLVDKLSDENVVDAFDLAEAYEQEIFTAFSNTPNTSSHSLLRFADSRIRISGIYASDSGDEIFVRTQNVSNDIFGSKLFVEFDFQSAHLCRLNEETGEEVFLYREYINADAGSADEREVCTMEINFTANELKTIKFQLRPEISDVSPAMPRARKRRLIGISRTG